MIRVMVVDDMPLARKVVAQMLQTQQGFEVVATAPNAETALAKLDQLEPDVVVMDLQMPGMGGLEAIRRIMRKRPTPVVVLSAMASANADLTLQALETGAVDFVAKPSADRSMRIADVSVQLLRAVRAAAGVHLPFPAAAPVAAAHDARRLARRGEHEGRYDLVAIGASTGGPAALKRLLMGLPPDFPLGVLVVQHMPPTFTQAFARRLNEVCGLAVEEARDGDELSSGRVLVAPGDWHMRLRRAGGKLMVALDGSSPVNGHRPSIDVLVESVAEEAGCRALGVIMTGMGRDGASGMMRLKERGGYVIAQDEASSVIFGMNHEAIKAGAVDEVVALDTLAQRIMQLGGGRREALE